MISEPNQTRALIYVEIEEACRINWARGREKYGPVFVSDPWVELDEEFLDAINYCREIESRGETRLKAIERGLMEFREFARGVFLGERT